MPLNLDDIAEQAKTANKETLQHFVKILVQAVDERRACMAVLQTEVDRLQGVARREKAYVEVVNAAKDFTTDRYHGLVGSANHVHQTRLIVALRVLEAVTK